MHVVFKRFFYAMRKPRLILFIAILLLSSAFTGKEKIILSKKPFIQPAGGNTNSNTNPDYVNRYKKIETYIPDENTPVKHIKIAVNIFTGPGTIQNSDTSVEAVIQMIQWLNDFYTKTDPATYPIAGVQAHSDTKIRFDLDDRIYFYDETKLYNITAINSLEEYIAGIDSSRLNNLNIYITNGGKASPYAIPPYPNFIIKGGSGYSASSLYGNQGLYLSTTHPSYVNAQTLAHEIGHCLDLFHTYKPSCCHETCDATDPEYLYDLFGTISSDNCWEGGGFGCTITPGENTCTNNIMGGNNMLNYYFSPMQIGKMHRALSVKSVRKYVKESVYNTVQHKINHNETWNFDIRWYSDIVIENGATLTLKGKILMADQAEITVKRGALLIIDGGIITSAGKSWQGVKTGKTKKRFKRFNGEGKVILKNGGAIENAKF